MHRLSLAAPSMIVLFLVAGACSGSSSSASEDTSPDGAAVETTSATAASDTGSSETAASSSETTETSAPETVSETTAPEETIDEVAQLCDGYLAYVAQKGTGALEEALGRDAPPGVLDAIETVNSSDVDYLDVLLAWDSLRQYVSPVCRTRWDEGLAPGGANEDVVNTFFQALEEGNEAAAIPIAPADVRANFDPWEPIEPDPEVGPPGLFYSGGGDFSMILAPTVTVFCTLNDGVITLCSFGE